MGHDTHFLDRLSRVEENHAELALSLYRDVPLVREILAESNAPPEAPRVAIALDAGEKPPHLVVSRDGGFVTCLGPGMHPRDLPIISKAALDGLAFRVRGLREAFEAVEELQRRGRSGARKLLACDGVSREDMQPRFLTQRLLHAPYMSLLDDLPKRALGGARALTRSSRVRKRDEGTRRQLWTDLWTAAHVAPLALAGLRDCDYSDEIRLASAGWLTVAGTRLGFIPGMLRVAWGLAWLGKPMLPVLKRLLGQPSEIDIAAVSLGALALRHPKHAAEVRKALERSQPDRVPCDAMLATLDDPATAEEVAHVAAGKLGVWWTQHLSERHPARWEPGDVPEALTLALLSRYANSIHLEAGRALLYACVPLLARARPEDFYLPAAVLDRLEPQDPIELLVPLIDRLRVDVRGPATAEAKPGRNDPCSCGSGRKFKKCCAA